MYVTYYWCRFFADGWQAVSLAPRDTGVRLGRQAAGTGVAREELRLPHVRDAGAEHLHRGPHAPAQDRQAGEGWLLVGCVKMTVLAPFAVVVLGFGAGHLHRGPHVPAQDRQAGEVLPLSGWLHEMVFFFLVCRGLVPGAAVVSCRSLGADLEQLLVSTPWLPCYGKSIFFASGCCHVVFPLVSRD